MKTITPAPGQPISSYSRTKFRLPFLAIAALFLALVAYQLYVSNLAARGAVTTDVKNLALVLESKLAADFAAAERTVSDMVSEIEPEAMQQETAGRYRPQITHWLKSNVRDISSASALRYFDAYGERLYSSVDGELSFNIADRPFFRQLKETRASSTIYSEVTFGRLSGRISMFVAKPVRAKDGNFLGTAVSVIDLNSIYDHFRSINLGKGGVVALRRLDSGASVVRFPGPVEVDNKPAPDFPVRRAILAGEAIGVMELVSPIDERRRIYGYRTVGTFPFFVAVGIADDDYLAQWRRNSIFLLAAAVLFLAILSVAESRRNWSEYRLRRSENRFRHLTELSADWYWEQDKNHRFTFVSSGFRVLTGVEDEVLGKTRWELPHVDTDPEVIREIEVLLAARQPFKDLVIKRMDAGRGIHYLQISGEPIFDERGQFEGYRGVGRDITQRMQNEEQIQQLIREQKAILDSRIVGIVKLRQRRIVWANDAFAEMLGSAKEKMIGQLTRIGYTSDEAYDAFAQSAYPVLQGGGIFRTEIQLVCKDGAIRWYEIAGGLLSPGIDESIWTFLDINERKVLEQSAVQNEQRMELALAGADLGLWDMDIATEEITHNPRFVTMLGYELGKVEMNGERFFSQIHPDDQPRFRSSFYSHLRGESTNFDIEYRILHRDGRWIWLLSRGRVVQRDEGGRALRMTGTTLDISERKRAEQALKSSEDKFRKAFYVNPDSININRLEDGLFASINRGFSEIMGYAESEVIGKTSLEINIWDNPEDRNTMVARLRKDGTLTNFETRFRAKDSTIRDSLMSAAIIDIEGVPHIISVIRDITEHKRTDRILRESEERYRSLFANAGDGILIMSRDEEIIAGNEAFARMHGYTTQEVLHLSLKDLLRPHDLMLAAVRLRRILAGEFVTVEVEHIHKDGHTIPVEVSASLIVSGDQVYLQTFHRDITERKRAEAALLAANQVAESANRAKTRFLAAASHDLRQPVQAINLFLDALAQTSLSDEQKEIFGYLGMSVRGLRELLNALLDISQLDAGVVNPEMVVVSAENLLRELDNEFGHIANGKNLCLRIFTRGDPPLATDASLLLRALRNIVGNAIKYTQHGGVLIGVRRRGARALIQVWDTGVGIAPQHIGHIFDEYFQVDNSARDRTKGTGLGLAIVKHLVKLIGGEIVCRSRPGRGTVFEVSLSLASAMSSDDKSRFPFSAADQDTDASSRYSGRRVVVIEDDLLVAKGIEQALGARGIAVASFASAEEALASSAIAAADLYVSDVRLPGRLNGIQLLDAIQRRSANSINAVLMTGDTASNQINASASCNWKVLFKPVDLRSLLSLL